MSTYMTPIVFVIRDEASMRESLGLLSRAAGWQAPSLPALVTMVARLGLATMLTA